MTKKEKLILLLKYPFRIINYGLQNFKEELFQKTVAAKYGIERLPTVDLLELFPDLQEDLKIYSFLEGTSLITDIILLKALARTFQKCSFLEIGSWRGESISNIAEVAEKCTSITLSEKEMKDMGFDKSFVDAHGFFSKNLKNIKVIKHNSQTYDFSVLNEKFDLIFIDGNHTFEGVFSDTKNVFNLRKNKESIIVWHDYGYTTERVRPSVLAAILKGIPKEKHKNLYHVSNTICAIYIEDKVFNTYITKYPSYPNKLFTIDLRAKKI